MGISDQLQKMKAEKLAANKAAGAAFLAENKKKEGVVELPSGLQYQVIVEGTGAKPGLRNKVRCHYHGTLIDGTIFDSSVQRGRSIDFPVSGVIKGWVEALQLMPAGSKWKLFIPSDLAYGDQQVSPQIGPGSTLIFDVELIEVM
ncbi:FKBP-type peptidyl-prolyl cis-trans isomerase [Pinibacter soli]|uniref:Peptidyl-prolyl cis-trans isomerase n=1 Tax=Pinibacter soli TaxID=3044211 RepID=A0ABT6RIY2_9BACT|nr:FKBP-type peptidyl-prolyl cis-trans isomerase [Pinibacter soli]MDI3321797.1 FKBP-type peptidyl-prolyl cis-trans isomerase [Pinibacter soli]